MRRWYSPRGARRGFALAALATAIWLGWAIGYVQGAQGPAPRTSGSATGTGHPARCPGSTQT